LGALFNRFHKLTDDYSANDIEDGDRSNQEKEVRSSMNRHRQIASADQRDQTTQR